MKNDLKKYLVEKNARADYNKFPSGFHHERNMSHLAFTHIWPVPEVLS